MTARTLRTISPIAATLLLAFSLQACGDSPTDPATDSLEPYSFEATVSGEMTGTAQGAVVAGTGTVEGSNRMRVIGLEGQFPDGEEHLIIIHFLSANPSAGSYSVAPGWAPGDSLGTDEVGVLFADVVGQGSAAFTHEAVSGALQLEVGSVEHLKGEIEVDFMPAQWLDLEGGTIRADARFRLK